MCDQSRQHSPNAQVVPIAFSDGVILNIPVDIAMRSEVVANLLQDIPMEWDDGNTDITYDTEVDSSGEDNNSGQISDEDSNCDGKERPDTTPHNNHPSASTITLDIGSIQYRKMMKYWTHYPIAPPIQIQCPPTPLNEFDTAYVGNSTVPDLRELIIAADYICAPDIINITCRGIAMKLANKTAYEMCAIAELEQQPGAL